MAIKSAQLYNWDWVYVEKDSREITLTQDVKNKIDNIPVIVNDFDSEDENAALSAAMWKLLKEQIDNISSMWKYLSSWDCTTGLPETDPVDNPHVYAVWDYYIISKINTSWTNYRPSDRQYTKWTASTVIETWAPNINDSYYYDWVNWILQPSWGRVITVDQQLKSWSTNAIANGVVYSALQTKANTTSIPTKLSQLTNDKDFVNSTEVNAAISQATSVIPTKVTQLVNDAQYQTLQQVNGIVTNATKDCVHKWDNLSSLTNDAGYQTASQVQAAIATWFTDWIREWDSLSKLDNTETNFQNKSQVDWAISTAVSSLVKKTDLDNAWYITDSQADAKINTAISSAHDSTKQDKLVSWVNIKTINGESLLGSSDIKIEWKVNIFVTKTEYEELPDTKLTDWNSYFIYEE